MDISKYVYGFNAYDLPFTKFEQYQLNQNENVNFIVPKDTEFLVSLEANVTRPLKWRLHEMMDSKILEYKKDNSIEPYEFMITSLKGDSNIRQNFLFKAKSVGSEKLVLKYIDIYNSEVNSELILNIEVK